MGVGRGRGAAREVSLKSLKRSSLQRSRRKYAPSLLPPLEAGALGGLLLAGLFSPSSQNFDAAQRGDKTLGNMAGKPKLHYFNGRGRMEPIRWMLAAAGVEFEEQYIQSKADLEKLKQDGLLLYQQVPMVEIDGMKMVQTRAILNYIAAKYNLYGKDIKQRALIDMYCEGAMDLGEMIMILPFKQIDAKEKEKEAAAILEKATGRYFPVYEKVLKEHGQDFLVGNQLSRADIQLLETILAAEEMKADILSKFPLLKAFKTRISSIPNIKKFLQPGSPRKPPTDAKAVAEAMKIFH